jgi:hypothetical protein
MDHIDGLVPPTLIVMDDDAAPPVFFTVKVWVVL